MIFHTVTAVIFKLVKKKKKKSNVKVLFYRVTAITFQYEYDDVNIACTVWSL